MGIIINGANGGFKGKAGSIIGSSWKGINYIKGLYKKRTKPLSEAQMIQQEKFRTLMRFLLPINTFLRIGFGRKSMDKQTPINSAFQFNLATAIVGTYPNFSVDYANVRIANGTLYGAGTSSVSHAAGELTFSWSPEANELFETYADDLVFVLAYHAEKEEFISTMAALTRKGATATFALPNHLQTGTLHTWMFLANRQKTRVSKSSYLGEVQLV